MVFRNYVTRRKAVQTQTLREQVVEFVKEAIIRGQLRPGQRVPEPDLALRFGVSRTPIREAFRQLESEGFLVFTPRKGAVVSPITPKDVREFYAIKSLLEAYAARQACARFTAKEIDRMEQLNRQMAQCAEQEDVRGFFDLDNQFHEVFHQAAGNDKLQHLIRTLVQHYIRFRVAALSVPGRMKNSVRQHEEIIDAFRQKDIELVDRLVRANAEQGCEVLVRELERAASSSL